MLLMLNGQQQSISSAVLSSGGGVDAIVTWAADNGLYASECETSMIAVVASMIVFRTIWPTDFLKKYYENNKVHFIGLVTLRLPPHLGAQLRLGCRWFATSEVPSACMESGYG
jgi:hypothetical protein